MSLADLADYCHSQLNAKALRYLKEERQLTDDTIEQWHLGFCPFDISWLINSLDREEMIKCKVLIETSEDVFSFMKNSIVFPFVDQYGKVVAVSSRPLQSNEIIKQKKLRKYWHSSFEKSWFLYGLNQAIPFIREKDQVIIGEGQIDVLMAHQYGFKNAVGTCGTALSVKHIALLARYASEILVVYDGDASGQKALNKLITKKQPGVQLKAVTMPSGEDIDSFLLGCGSTKFCELLESANA